MGQGITASFANVDRGGARNRLAQSAIRVCAGQSNIRKPDISHAGDPQQYKYWAFYIPLRQLGASR
jgi:hypothetical protein